ncbi:hypothetical protein I9W82_001718 [Candida metapsilosis]|uniref:Uncharacterized protein n=1 Tax=Candida metapsilosis TaxID=273372 RepID=A0A8H7ZIM0_9ASCO|nr:hypothetical protein I9W82_001718 [Candida metapsilosis]
MSITVRENNVYYQLEFNYNTSTNDIAIPAPTMFLDFKIYINSHVLTVGDNDELVRSISDKFKSFWNRCHYDTSFNISDASPFSFSLVCKDTVFEPTSLPKINSIEICLSVLSLEEIDLQGLLIAFNYLMTSWFLNEESKYPAVFSSSGRQFIKHNLFWYKKMYYEVMETQLVKAEKVVCNYINVVKENYTTLKLMNHVGAVNDSRRGRGRKCLIKRTPLNLVDHS